MRVRALVWFVLLLGLALAQAAPQSDPDGKLRLVERWLHAAQFGESLQNGIRKTVAAEHKSNAFLNAILAAPPERIERIVSPAFAKRLTLEEAQIVAEFNDSATGRAMNAEMQRRAAGAAGQPFDLTSEQQAEFLRYASTPAALKARDLMSDAATRDEYLAALRQAFGK